MAIILRTYVARGRDLPGVRSGDHHPWPASTQTRPTASTVPGNGGDYVATRRALHSRYAAPWLLALHDQDIAVYATTLFDLQVEYAEEQSYWDPALLGEMSERQISVSISPVNHCPPLHAAQKRQAIVADTILRHIIKICQTSIVFTVFDDLFKHWLERVDALEVVAHVRNPFLKDMEILILVPASTIPSPPLLSRG